MKKIFLPIIIFTLLSGCDNDNSFEIPEPFEIRVVAQDGEPVAGATIEGGVDWDAFKVQTNSEGSAVLFENALKSRILIYKTNYLPTSVYKIIPDNVYILRKTAKQLNFIGNVEGKAVRFLQNELVTLDYNGNYHLYSYNDQSVSEISSQYLNDSIVAIPEFHLIGSQLWIATHNSGIFVYSIQNPSSPQLLFSLPVTDYLGPFAVKDSILAVGDKWEPGPVRFFVYRQDGYLKEVSRIQNYFVRNMLFIRNNLVITGNSESLPTIFDISNITSPNLLYNGLDWEYKSAFFYNQKLILTPKYAYGGEYPILDYKLLDLSNPALPVQQNIFSADSWLTGLASDNIAYGNYYFHNQTTSILEGDIYGYSFQTIATVSERAYEGVAGAFPPYFIIGNSLWKLVDRN